MIQDIAPEAFHIAYAAQAPAPGDAVLCYHPGQVLCRAEGDGLASSTIAACDYTVKIPMSHGVDSLNVAAASAVAFYQLALLNG